jgi:hypothetical protein
VDRSLDDQRWAWGVILSDMDLDDVRAATVGTLDRLLWQTQDVLDLLVRPAWGTAKHGYDRLLYGVVMNTMAVADRVSFYREPNEHGQTKRMRALFEEMGAAAEAAAVTVQIWRHSLMHTGEPLPLVDSATGTTYRWLLHWGEDHLPRDQHLTFAEGQGSRVLALGAVYAVADLRAAAQRTLSAAERDADVATRLVSAHEAVLARQSRALRL